MTSSSDVFTNPDAIMKAVKAMSPYHYDAAMSDQVGGGGMPVFQGMSRQMGSGFISDALTAAAKYVIPKVVSGLTGVHSDVSAGVPLKKAIRKQAVRFLRGSGSSLRYPTKRKQAREAAANKPVKKRRAKKSGKKDIDWMI